MFSFESLPGRTLCVTQSYPMEEGHSCAGCFQLQQTLDAQEATASLYKEKLVATHEMLVELSAKKQVTSTNRSGGISL